MVLGRLENRQAYIVRKKGITTVGEGSGSAPIELALTATTSIKFKGTSTVSSSPVTSGNDRADHITLNNDVFTLSGIIDEKPLALSFGKGVTRKTYVDALDSIRKNKELVDVYFYEIGGNLSDCVITSVSYEKTLRTGDGLKVQLTLKKILQKGNNIVKPVSTASDALAAKKAGGNAPTEVVETEYTVDAVSQ